MEGALKTATNAAWLTFCRLAADCLGFLLFVAIARRFGPDGTGSYAYAFAVAGLVSLGGTLGLQEYGTREYVRLPAHECRRLHATLVAAQGMGMVLALLALAVFLAVSRPDHETAVITWLLSGYMLGAGLARTLFVPATAELQMAAPAVAELVCRSAAILCALFMILYLHQPLRISLIGFPVCGFALTAVGALSAHRHGGAWRPGGSWRGVAAAARAAWPFAASDVVAQFYARADLILLSLLVGENAAGIYASGFKFIEVGAMPLGFISLAAYPSLARLFQSNQANRRAFTALACDLLRATLLLGGLMAWGLFYVLPAVLLFVFGDRFAEAVPVVKLLSGLALFYAAESVLLRVMLAAHLQVAALRMLVLGTLLNVGLNLLLIPSFEIRGAVAAWIVTLVVIDVLYAAAVREYLPPALLLTLFGPFAASVSAACGVALLAARFADATWVAAAASLAAFAVASLITGLVPLPAGGAWAAGLWPRRSDKLER